MSLDVGRSRFLIINYTGKKFSLSTCLEKQVVFWIITRFNMIRLRLHHLSQYDNYTFPASMMLEAILVLLEEAGESSDGVTANNCNIKEGICQACLEKDVRYPCWDGERCVGC